jgi:glyceraldehyde 3-phosphate dehydrogenase
MKVGINGMGRIGRLALRAAMGAAERQSDDPRAGNRLEVVHLNELKGGAAATAHLLTFDTVQGRWREDIAAEGDSHIHIGSKQLGFSSHATAAEIPWGDLGVDVVLECTGKFLTPETIARPPGPWRQACHRGRTGQGRQCAQHRGGREPPFV